MLEEKKKSIRKLEEKIKRKLLGNVGKRPPEKQKNIFEKLVTLQNAFQRNVPELKLEVKKEIEKTREVQEKLEKKVNKIWKTGNG